MEHHVDERSTNDPRWWFVVRADGQRALTFMESMGQAYDFRPVADAPAAEKALPYEATHAKCRLCGEDVGSQGQEYHKKDCPANNYNPGSVTCDHDYRHVIGGACRKCGATLHGPQQPVEKPANPQICTHCKRQMSEHHMHMSETLSFPTPICPISGPTKLTVNTDQQVSLIMGKSTFTENLIQGTIVSTLEKQKENTNDGNRSATSAPVTVVEESETAVEAVAASGVGARVDTGVSDETKHKNKVGKLAISQPEVVTPKVHEKDNCKICFGANGGVKGNENIIGGVVMCDYCTVKVRAIHGAALLPVAVAKDAIAVMQDGSTGGATKRQIEQLKREAEEKDKP